MIPSSIDRCAEILDDALRNRREIERLTAEFPSMTLEDAYAIQTRGIGLRLARGEKIVGYKMGLTSKAKMEQMGLHTPIAGVLTNAMEVHGGAYALARGVHPKAEPEIAFKIGRTVRTPLSAEDALAHCSHVAPALEILDSRFKGFKYFSLNDVVADNCSSHAFAVGTWVPLAQAPRARNSAIELEVGGALREHGRSSDVLGDPAESLSQLTKILHSWGVDLPAGSVVLTGAITAAPKLERGMFLRLRAEGFQDLTLRCE